MKRLAEARERAAASLHAALRTNEDRLGGFIACRAGPSRPCQASRPPPKQIGVIARVQPDFNLASAFFADPRISRLVYRPDDQGKRGG